MKRVDFLTDLKIRNAAPRERDFKMNDGRGLYLLIRHNGSKLWRMDYTIDGKRKTLSFGAYPIISLRDARMARDEALRSKWQGRDPALVKKAAKDSRRAEGLSFEKVAREWHGKNRPVWSESHGVLTLRRLELNVFPFIGTHPVGSLSAKDVLNICLRIEERGAKETAHRVLQIIGSVFRFAVANGLIENDPTPALRGALAPRKVKHMAAILQPAEIGPLLRAMDAYKGSAVTRAALRLTPLLMLRPGELRRLEWAEIDFHDAVIRIPEEKMKKGREHLVPLSRQAIAILKDIRPLTGQSRYVFPSERTLERPMSENTVNGALIRLGYKHEQTAHGFRAMSTSLLKEMGCNPDAVERQHAHVEKNAVRAAYNRGEYLDARREIMQKWADYLDRLRNDTLSHAGGARDPFPDAERAPQ